MGIDTSPSTLRKCKVPCVNKLVYVGHSGSGFDEAGLKDLYDKMKPLIIDECPFDTVPKTNEPAKWLKPKLVGQIKFSEWAHDGLMRQPIFLGLREDKSPKEVVRERSRP